MRQGLRRRWLPLAGACSLLLGCAHSPASRYPPDPLLLTKRPIESHAEAGPLLRVAQHEPPAPEDLATAVAARSRPTPAVPTSLHRDDTDER